MAPAISPSLLAGIIYSGFVGPINIDSVQLVNIAPKLWFMNVYDTSSYSYCKGIINQFKNGGAPPRGI